MESQSKHSHIPGWGADLNHADRPAVPMEKSPPGLQSESFKQPEQQPVTVEVLRSIERPDITPVFGTSRPPRGVSGIIRRVAFHRSENDLRHWILLLAADRVDVVEGMAIDLVKSPRLRTFSMSVIVVGLGLLAARVSLRRAGRPRHNRH